ncbi:MAG: serine hydrolase domain-containing protein [Gemmatimonadaceae bacterium]
MPATRLLAAAFIVLTALEVGTGATISPAATAGPAGVRPQTARLEGPTDAVELERFVDSVMSVQMRAERTPGAAFVFVRDGRILLKKGYGYSDADRKRPVSPDSTIFRIGSISKVFTAFALVQMADRGLIDLNVDVNRYLRRVKVPDAFGAPVTGINLLDHTAGFDEVRPGTQAPSENAVEPLARFLAPRLRRVRPPGQTISYSTYGMTLAGELVEELSGLAFEEYLQKNVFRPLGMASTNITVPQRLKQYVSPPFEMAPDSSITVAGWEWYHTTPASSMNSTAGDMAKFIIANLNESKPDTMGVMTSRTLRFMQRQHITMHPRLPGFALGFYEDYVGDLRLLEHGGNVEGFSAQIVLIPTAHAGFFVVNHREQSQVRDNLKAALLARYYPSSAIKRIVPPPDLSTRAGLSAFVGSYAWTTSCHTCVPRSVPSILRVVANPDGTLSFAGGKWIQVEPLLFVRENGTGYIAFRSNATGAIDLIAAGGFWTFERLPD